jgi:branched-chain amino acid transport system ATP-binding protein
MLFRGVDIHTSYGGGVDILKGLNVEIDKGEVVTLLGANGAGKTTLVKVISGLLAVSKGKLEFEGEAIEGTAANERVRLGISMCPEGRKLFGEMTVLENLKLGAYLVKDREQINQSIEDNFKLFPILKKRQNQIAGTLSGGEQQMLALSRALMSRPKLFILDEPTLGLAPLVVTQIYEVIAAIAHRGTTLLLVEQNASVAVEISQRGYVLETGKIVLEGSRNELKSNPRIREAYLGG